MLSSESRNLLPGGGADIAKELASSGQLMDTVFGVCPPIVYHQFMKRLKQIMSQEIEYFDLQIVVSKVFIMQF